MSDIREVDYRCPHCRAHNKASFHTRIDARKEPDLAAQLLGGALSTVTCWQCRDHAPMEHSLVFVAEGGAVWLDPPKDPLAMANPPAPAGDARMRRVRDSNSLREIAAIWRDGLDDRAMLLLKHMLAAKLLEETGSAPLVCAFEERLNTDGGEWLEYVVFTSEEGDPETLRTSFATYSGVQGALTANADRVEVVFPPGRWVDWDGDAAKAMWEAMQGS